MNSSHETFYVELHIPYTRTAQEFLRLAVQTASRKYRGLRALQQPLDQDYVHQERINSLSEKNQVGSYATRQESSLEHLNSLADKSGSFTPAAGFHDRRSQSQHAYDEQEKNKGDE
jgi:hypothetical protein